MTKSEKVQLSMFNEKRQVRGTLDAIVSPTSCQWRESCEQWYSIGQTNHNYPGRQKIGLKLLKEYGKVIFMKHLPKIKKAMDRIEIEVALKYLDKLPGRLG